VNLLTEQNVSRSLALLQPQDIYMRPELGDITAGSFERQLDAAVIGRKTAEAQLAKLRGLGVPQAQYDAWKANLRSQGTKAPPRIDEVQVVASTHIDPLTVRESITQKEGEPLDTEALSRDLILVYSRGDLQTVDYSVLTERDKTILRVTPVEKPWGPDYLRFGVNLSSDFHDSDFNLRALYRRTWLNYLGGEWLTTLQVGSQHKLGTEFYQPLDRRARWFVNPYVTVEGEKTGLYVNGDRVADYYARSWHAGIDVGANLGVIGQARVGWQEKKLKAEVETGLPVMPNFTQRSGGPRAVVNLDTYDFAFFPTRGFKFDATVYDAQHVSENGPKYGVAEAKLGAAMTAGDFIFLGELEGGMPTHGKLPVGELFALGGPRRLAGFAQRQILGEEYAYARVDAQYRLTRPIPLLGLSLIAGVAVEAGRMRNPINEPSLTGWQSSFNAYLATNSAFGPIHLGIANAKNGEARIFFFVGTP
jgi:NTE family protein